MEDETPTSAEETVGAPGTVEAASETGAPATPPDGYIESKRYEDLRSNHDRINSLVDRARQGDSEALKELTGYEFAESEQETEPETDQPDPIASLEQRLAAQEERDQQRAAQESVKQFNADLDKLASDKGATLSERERKAVYSETLLSGGSPRLSPEGVERPTGREGSLRPGGHRPLRQVQAIHTRLSGRHGCNRDALPGRHDPRRANRRGSGSRTASSRAVVVPPGRPSPDQLGEKDG
jgi:hypothetical protein